jgi:N-acetylglucosaminyldiphosphoundecaprenol N-acetyl-beta-D-mannosaminyltransferase
VKLSAPTSILTIPFWDIRPEDLREWVLRVCAMKGVRTVHYLNPHACVLARKNSEFYKALCDADLTWCDGQGIVLGTRILGRSVENRWTLPDHIDPLFQRLELEDKTAFFIGERSENIEIFREIVQNRYPKLQILGIHHGFFEPEGVEERALVEKLNADRPDIIFIGMGMPRQELFAKRLKVELTNGVVFSVGALYLYYAGLAKRCPPFFSKHGFEWLYRLMWQPIKYFHRYVIENLNFLWLVFREKRALEPSSGKQPRHSDPQRP